MLEGDDDASVRRAALWSLQELSHLRWNQDVEGWSTWLNGQQAWFAEQSTALFETARSPDPARAKEALRQLEQHPLFAHEVAPHVALALAHERPEIARAACTALGRLRSPLAIRPLVRMLATHSPEVQETAMRALHTLTGVDLPSSVDAWEEWLDAAS